MSKFSYYIKARTSLSGCNAKQFECDKYLDCDSCLEDKIKEHDKQIKEETIIAYSNKLNEKLKADTKLKDTIREIHDNVAREMYCKGIDDLSEKLKACCFISPHNVRTIERLAEELKENYK